MSRPDPRARASRATGTGHRPAPWFPALAGLALVALSWTMTPPAAAQPVAGVVLERGLGRRDLELRWRGADSVATLPDRRLLAGTDSVWVDGVPLARGAGYRLEGDPARLLLLRRPPDSSRVRVRYRFLPVPLADIYQYRGIWSAADPGAADPGSSAAAGERGAPPTTAAVAGARAPAAAGGEALGKFSLSGSKTLAFEVGTNRDLAVRQSLDLSLGGEIGSDVGVVAILSDRNLPLTPEGRTQDLGNLDKVVVELKSPTFGASLGDFDLRLDAGRYASMQRTVQGARGRVRLGGADVEAAAALGKGVFLSRQFPGEEGRQGPYRLTDPSGRTGIAVVPGTEQVWLDGARMARGDGADYTVDYSRGEVSFTARRPIHPGSRIAVDYQYAADQFRRNVAAVRLGWDAGRSGRLGFTWLREADDPSRPLGAALSPEDLEALKRAAPGGTVQTDGAHFVGAGKGDYARIGAGSGQEHFQYVGRDSGEYQVDFMLARDGSGSYSDSLVAGGLAYAWRGSGRGAYVPGRLLPVPASHAVAALAGGVSHGRLRVEGEGAVSLQRANLLAGGAQGTGGAWNLGLLLGRPTEVPGAGTGAGAPVGGGVPLGVGGSGLPIPPGSAVPQPGRVELEVRARREAESFEPLGRTLDPFVEEEWNLSPADRTRGRTVITSALRARPGAGVSAGLEVGSWRTESGRQARRLTCSGERQGRLGWQLQWASVTNRDSAGADAGSRRRGRAAVSWTGGKWRPEAHWSHDLARDSAGQERSGWDDAGVSLRWASARGVAAEAAQAWRRDFGPGLATAAQPLRSSTQRVGLQYAGSPDWGLNATLSQRTLAGRADSLGATRNAQLQFLLHRSSLEGEARYDIGTARTAARARQVIYVGPGLGSYDSLGTYTGRGDYTVNTFDTALETAANLVALNARLEWSGERAGRSDWLRHFAARTEAQASQSVRRAAGSSLLPWPGSIPDDPNVLSGNAVFRQDLEWNDGQGRLGLRLRHEWTGSADRQYSTYGQARRGRTESARLRLAGRAGTSLEVEGRWRRRETALGSPGAEARYATRGFDGTLGLRWVPGPQWSGGLNARLLSEEDAGRGSSSRQLELGPGLTYSRAGRFRAELRALRVKVTEEGGIGPGFDNFGSILRSRFEHDLAVTLQVHAAVQASVLAHGTRPDGGRWTETARFEMRALF
ncbi:MAG: hypothetical protein HZB25_00325 [Candidatus Eisenbacteria bacterium]|nr:hypothetical protein [Candidatus Eisenbacteria bacterium]